MIQLTLPDGYVYEAGYSHQIEPSIYGLYSSFENAVKALPKNAKMTQMPPQYDHSYWSFGDGHYIRKIKVLR